MTTLASISDTVDLDSHETLTDAMDLTGVILAGALHEVGEVIKAGHECVVGGLPDYDLDCAVILCFDDADLTDDCPELTSADFAVGESLYCPSGAVVIFEGSKEECEYYLAQYRAARG